MSRIIVLLFVFLVAGCSSPSAAPKSTSQEPVKSPEQPDAAYILELTKKAIVPGNAAGTLQNLKDLENKFVAEAGKPISLRFSIHAITGSKEMHLLPIKSGSDFELFVKTPKWKDTGGIDISEEPWLTKAKQGDAVVLNGKLSHVKVFWAGYAPQATVIYVSLDRHDAKHVP